MTKRMLIDATHGEETRVVVLDGNRIEDFDVETSAKKQLKGNIYLARVVRVEPSLQAAFVEYGGGRHGFLAFGEIHPDYYQIPVADRQRLLALQAEEALAEAEDEDDEPEAFTPTASETSHPDDGADEAIEGTPDIDPANEPGSDDDPLADEEIADEGTPVGEDIVGSAADRGTDAPEPSPEPDADAPSEDHAGRAAQPALMARDERFGPLDAEVAETPLESLDLDPSETTLEDPPELPAETGAREPARPDEEFPDLEVPSEKLPPPETLGGEPEASQGAEDARRRRESRFLRNYRIQEVIRRRQVMLIQVVKEERGTKGAALTTYISLAGRFCVLMPNSPRGGGISRKITSAADRRRLKEVTAELDLPAGMGLIVRTAGAARPKPEIMRDCEYLMRLWDDIREHTLRSIAPALIYEEASLIKRAIRDVYSRDIDEIVVDGEPGWRAAYEFMRMLMPSHAKKVQLWRGTDGGVPTGGAIAQPLFARHQVEAQLDAMLSPTVQLKSGGYLVIDQTEALVAIDVNSGRSTRERNIEETAFRTNLEAADEAARQLRLRDLAGLIVIDFIDMESRKNNASVERRLKEALRVDRARIQVGPISHFGLLEMSRQRLRPSVTETSFVACPHCSGSGHVRSTESAAIHVLRAIEDEGGRGRAAVVMVHAASSLVMFLLNHKRDRLAEIELRTGMRVQFAMDEQLVPPACRIEKVRARTAEDRPLAPPPVAPVAPQFDAQDEAEDIETEEDEVAGDAAVTASVAGESAEDSERRRRRRRRRRGKGRDGAESTATSAAADGTGDEGAEEGFAAEDDAAEPVPAMPPSSPDDAPAFGSESASTGSDEAADISAAAPDDPAHAAAPFEGTPEEGAETEAARARRRGRRGGRRRRRDETADGSEPAEEQVAAQVAYDGPTPANPFGGGAFDIYDLLDTAPHEPAPAASADPVAADFAVNETDAPAPPDPAAPEDLHSEALPEVSPESAEQPIEAAEPATPEPATPEPATPEPATPEPATPEPEHAARPEPAYEMAAVGEPFEPEPAEAPASRGPVIGDPVKPTVIGAGDPVGERKRGWWRR